MFIPSKQGVNKIMSDSPVLEVAGEFIQVSDSEKLLGVHIDSTLSWTSEVEAAIKKCNSLLYLLNRIKQYLSIPLRKLFCYAYMLPHWGD